MSRERWERAKSILQHALERAEEDRQRFVEDSCAGDELLRSEVEQLLTEYRDDDGFLEPPVRARREWIGRMLVQRYRIERSIGVGSFGEVYLANDKLGGERVAVKIYRAPATRARKLFRREIATLRWLRLPGIVQLFDEGVEDGHAFIVMEYVEGRPFPGHAAPTTWDAIRGTTLALVESVGRLHWAGVFHCDLKPNNVLVRRDGSPIVLDLGVSAGPAVTGVSALGSELAGTPRYVAPERFSGERPDPRSDLYSIGVMLYEALARPGTEGHEMAQRRIGWNSPTEWPPLREAAPDVPAPVAAAVDRLLSADAKDRPASAGRLLAQLAGDARQEGALDRVGWIGSRRPLESMRAAARDGRSLVIAGAPGSGRTRALQEVRNWLEADGTPTASVVAGEGPFESLRAALPDAATAAAHASLAEVESALEAHLRSRLRAGTVLLVDDRDEADRWSRRVIDACRADGCVLATQVDDPCDIRLHALAPRDLESIFAGPERLHHLRTDAARELWRRTSGWPRRIARELESWERAGLARREGDSYVIRRTSLERLRSGLFVGSSAENRATIRLERDLEELLVWIDAAGGRATRDMLETVLGAARWKLEAELQSLLEQRAIGEAASNRFVALWPTHGGQLWPEEKYRGMHTRLAEVSQAGTPERFRHLLAAHRFDELATESLTLARKQLDRGHASSAESTLIEGLRWSFNTAGADDAEHFLLPLLDAAMTSGTAQSLNRLLHYCNRLDPERTAVRSVETITRAALWTYRNDAERALEETETALDTPLLERFRHAVRVHAASGLGLDRLRPVVRDAVAWAESTGDDAANRAASAEWRGWLAYAEADYAAAARHHSDAAELAPTQAKRTKSYTDAAWAALEQADFAAADELAKRAAETAAECRHAHYEARAETIRRMVAYRTLRARVPDLELVDAAGRIGVSHTHGVVALTEAAVAWRAGRLAVGRDLADLAARELRNSGMSMGETLALALAVLCGQSMPDSLLTGARDCALPGIQVQLFGMLANAGTALGAADIEAARDAARQIPTDLHSIRREVVSVSEALQWIKQPGEKE